jgi:uncharacterized membrane protein YgcG
MSVDPSALSATGGTVGGEGDAIAAAVGSLDSALSGAGAMFGHDAAGLVFAQSYTASGNALLDAAASAVNACRRVGFGIQTSAANYGHANASSTVGGGAPPVPTPRAPAQFSAPGMPPPLGSGIAAPLGWSLVEAFVGDVWPDGNPGRLHAAAGSWRSFGAAVSGLAGQVGAAGPGLGAQQIPEAGQMVGALGQIGGRLTDIAAQAQALATAVDGFANTVDATQNAVRGLLHQLSPAGILETVGGIFTGHDPMEKIKEVAHEIKTVLDNMKREADASSQIFSQGINLLDSATNSLEKWANKEFTYVFGQAVGGALSADFNALVDLPEGGVKFVLGTVQGLQQLDPTRFVYDPSGAAKSWEGMLETTAVLTNPELLVTKIATDPQGSLDTLKGMVDWKDVEDGHPFRALGYDGAQVAAAVVPGVGEAEPAVVGAEIEGRVAGTSAEVEEQAAAGVTRDGVPLAGRATSVTDGVGTQATRIGNDLNNVKVPESTAPLPAAAPGPSAPVGRAPVESAPVSPGDAPGGRAPVDHAPPAGAPHPETPTPHVPDSGSAPEPRAPEVSSPQQPEPPVPATPHDADLAPMHGAAPTSHTPEPMQIAQNDPARPPTGGGGPYESMPAASEPSMPMDESTPPTSGGHTGDMAAAAGADDKVPVSVGAHSGESGEGASGGGSGHGSGGSDHGSGGGGSGHGSGGDGSGHKPDADDPTPPTDHDHHSDVKGDHGDQDGHGSPAADHTPPHGTKVPGLDYPLPASDALQVLQDPAAEATRLSDGGVPQKILDGYDPLAGRSLEEFQNEFTIADADGTPRWDWEGQAPNNGFAGDPIETDQIPDGHQLDRIGPDTGGFMADEGLPMGDRGMAPGAAAQYHRYSGTGMPVPDDENWIVQHGPAKPAFGQPGGADQWVVIDLDTNKPVPVIELIRAGMLR